jgi:hypothetical protein
VIKKSQGAIGQGAIGQGAIGQGANVPRSYCQGAIVAEQLSGSNCQGATVVDPYASSCFGAGKNVDVHGIVFIYTPIQSSELHCSNWEHKTWKKMVGYTYTSIRQHNTKCTHTNIKSFLCTWVRVTRRTLKACKFKWEIDILVVEGLCVRDGVVIGAEIGLWCSFEHFIVVVS